MKLIKYLFFILVFASAGYAQNVRITDFNVPVSVAKRMLVGGSYNWAQTGDSVTTNQFNVNGLYNTFYTSLPFSWNVGVTAALDGKYQDSTRASYNLNANINKYFAKTTGAFYYLGLTSSYLRKSEFGTENRPQIDIEGGFGYGRYINATAMAQAIRVDQDLKKYGVTNAYMPKQTMQNIAAIIDKQSEYETKYKSVFEYKMVGDILKEVENSGVAGDFVNSSLSYFRIREVIFGINQFQNDRYYGGDIKAGVGYTVLTRNKNLTGVNPTLNLTGQYGYPIDINQQIGATVTAKTPFDSSFAKLVEGTAQVGYSYNLTNRISFIATYSVGLQQQVDTDSQTGVSIVRDFSTGNNLVTAGFNFYIENYIILNLNTQYSKLHSQEARTSFNVGSTFTIF
ncbi:MAG: hypothetical protein KDD00_04775 [Ignavibacteriae bacterium]|nr:hypothetical protein [Ignavibacteriota bacterium]